MNSSNSKSLLQIPYKPVRKTYLHALESENLYLNKIIRDSITQIQNIAQGKLDASGIASGQSHELMTQLDLLTGTLLRQQQVEEEQKWSAQGLAMFMDILQRAGQNLTELGDRLIASLVRYMGINQGGLFITATESNATYIDLLSCYAYERKKYIQKRLVPGVGLLGQAFLEKHTIYMTQVPSDYIKITSGLGEATPRCLLIVPVVLKDETMGLIELASLTALPDYKIKFVEKLAESLAAAIHSVHVSERTALLLREAQQYSEELSAQSEEMRQNMEELQAVQEELDRKTKEIERLRNTEKERTEKQLEGQKKIMEKINRNFLLKEDNYKRRIQELESEVLALKTQDASVSVTQ